MAEGIIPSEPTPQDTEVTPQEPQVVLPSDVEPFTMPEEFAGKSAEDIAKEYLEFKKSKETPEDPEPQPKEDDEKPDGKDSESIDKLIEKYVQRGTELTEDDYAELESKGYSKKQVDIYKAGIEAQQAQEAKALMDKAGTNLVEVQEAANWARENWDETRIAQYNEAITQAPEAVQIEMIRMLTDQFKAGKVAPQEPIHSSVKPAPQSKGYASMEEMVSDMKDPRYDQRSFQFDPAYYQAVRDKASRSEF